LHCKGLGATRVNARNRSAPPRPVRQGSRSGSFTELVRREALGGVGGAHASWVAHRRQCCWAVALGQRHVILAVAHAVPIRRLGRSHMRQPASANTGLQPARSVRCVSCLQGARSQWHWVWHVLLWEFGLLFSRVAQRPSAEAGHVARVPGPWGGLKRVLFVGLLLESTRWSSDQCNLLHCLNTPQLGPGLF